MVKKILIGLLVMLLVLQFFRPERNVGGELITQEDISKTVSVPSDVHDILVKKCYDCHSNVTQYPWYFNIQPAGLWLAHHVDEGKSELNFSTFKSYDEKKAMHKLEEIGEVTEDGSMPLTSYVVLHPETELTPADKDLIKSWLKSLNVEEHHH